MADAVAYGKEKYGKEDYVANKMPEHSHRQESKNEGYADSDPDTDSFYVFHAYLSLR